MKIIKYVLFMSFISVSVFSMEDFLPPHHDRPCTGIANDGSNEIFYLNSSKLANMIRQLCLPHIENKDTINECSFSASKNSYNHIEAIKNSLPSRFLLKLFNEFESKECLRYRKNELEEIIRRVYNETLSLATLGAYVGAQKAELEKEELRKLFPIETIVIKAIECFEILNLEKIISSNLSNLDKAQALKVFIDQKIPVTITIRSNGESKTFHNQILSSYGTWNNDYPQFSNIKIEGEFGGFGMIDIVSFFKGVDYEKVD